MRVLVTLAGTATVLLALLGPIDEAGKAYADAGLRRALIAYGVARSLNGVISVAQGTEVAVEPAGVGVTFKPGEILDPLNDLIERFSWIVLASGTSLGIQRVLLNVAAYPSFSILVSSFVVAAVWLAWRPVGKSPALRRVVHRAALALVVARFAIPVIAIASETLYEIFLEDQYVESTQKLEKTATTIQSGAEGHEPTAGTGESSMLETALQAYRSARDAVAVDERIAVLKEAAADVGEYTIDLIVVFVLETILFPLLFLWLALQLFKRSLAGAVGAGD